MSAAIPVYDFGPNEHFPNPAFIRRKGFCLFTDAPAVTVKNGTVHARCSPEHQMTVCGANTRSRPLEMRFHDCWTHITCVRCLSILMLWLNRTGRLTEATK